MFVEKHQTFVGPNDGLSLPILNMVHKITADRFGGALTIIEWGLPPGAMIPPHTHSREDECNFVLKGELTCDVGGAIGVAPAGWYVLKPRGVPHALCNAGTEPVRVLEILTPGGLESYFDEYEEIVSSALSEDQRRKARAELGERYGITWHDERIPEARVRFGIGAAPERRRTPWSSRTSIKDRGRQDERRIYNPVQKDVATFLETSEETGGERTLAEVAPGGGTRPHYHKTYAEHFEVIEGALEVLVGGETRVLRAGQKAVVPKNTLHRFHNATDETVTFLCEMGPGQPGTIRVATASRETASPGPTGPRRTSTTWPCSSTGPGSGYPASSPWSSR